MDLARVKKEMSSYNIKEIPNGTLVRYANMNTSDLRYGGPKCKTQVGVIVSVCQRAWGSVRYKVFASNGTFVFIWDNRLEQVES